MTSEKTRIVLTAGGTGGHVFPAEALAKELTGRNIDISFITDRRGNSFSGKFPDAKEYRIFAGAYAGKPVLKKMFANPDSKRVVTWRFNEMLKKYEYLG